MYMEKNIEGKSIYNNLINKLSPLFSESEIKEKLKSLEYFFEANRMNVDLSSDMDFFTNFQNLVLKELMKGNIRDFEINKVSRFFLSEKHSSEKLFLKLNGRNFVRSKSDFVELDGSIDYSERGENYFEEVCLRVSDVLSNEINSYEIMTIKDTGYFYILKKGYEDLEIKPTFLDQSDVFGLKYDLLANEGNVNFFKDYFGLKKEISLLFLESFLEDLIKVKGFEKCNDEVSEEYLVSFLNSISKRLIDMNCLKDDSLTSEVYSSFLRERAKDLILDREENSTMKKNEHIDIYTALIFFEKYSSPEDFSFLVQLVLKALSENSKGETIKMDSLFVVNSYDEKLAYIFNIGGYTFLKDRSGEYIFDSVEPLKDFLDLGYMNYRFVSLYEVELKKYMILELSERGTFEMVEGKLNEKLSKLTEDQKRLFCYAFLEKERGSRCIVAIGFLMSLFENEIMFNKIDTYYPLDDDYSLFEFYILDGSSARFYDFLENNKVFKLLAEYEDDDISTCFFVENISKIGCFEKSFYNMFDDNEDMFNEKRQVFSV